MSFIASAAVWRLCSFSARSRARLAVTSSAWRSATRARSLASLSLSAAPRNASSRAPHLCDEDITTARAPLCSSDCACSSLRRQSSRSVLRRRTSVLSSRSLAPSPACMELCTASSPAHRARSLLSVTSRPSDSARTRASSSRTLRSAACARSLSSASAFAEAAAFWSLLRCSSASSAAAFAASSSLSAALRAESASARRASHSLLSHAGGGGSSVRSFVVASRRPCSLAASAARRSARSARSRRRFDSCSATSARILHLLSSERSCSSPSLRRWLAASPTDAVPSKSRPLTLPLARPLWGDTSTLRGEARAGEEGPTEGASIPLQPPSSYLHSEAKKYR
eukprot:Hpha_TRINITY_DN18996_c0_g1::TRINITY_DN18996_c0_g1_i1::g.17468::m.17468